MSNMEGRFHMKKLHLNNNSSKHKQIWFQCKHWLRNMKNPISSTILQHPSKLLVMASISAQATGDGGFGGVNNYGGSGGNNGWGGDGSLPNFEDKFCSIPTDTTVHESSELIDDIILFDIGGMMCGGCVSHVKKILEDQPNVIQATVNLATETALVRVKVPQEGLTSALQSVAERIASVVSGAGYKCNVRSSRDSSSSSSGTVLAAKRLAKEQRLRQLTLDLAIAWGLTAMCGLGHIGHFWKGAPAWIHALHSYMPFNAAVSVAALLGPGRDILVNGFQSLMRNAPDMNTLVGLGASASFGVSCVAALMPSLGWRTFFEEPAMLLGFVLLGRTLEERAKLQASSDMTALHSLVPSKARLIKSDGSWVEVEAEVLGPGDVVKVLPGDRVPVDGVVIEGRSMLDESAITGEPLPVVKTEGSKVVAGTVNCDGVLSVAAERSGSETVVADIVRQVEAAQARTAPIQRLADVVAGKFAYGVMGLSAATLLFWSTVGTKIFPQALAAAAKVVGLGGAECAACVAAHPSTPLLLALHLATNVLVCACPCALGLATPTAVLVGSAAAAQRGLLVRGGDVLESLSQVNVVVLDKTGTLTSGKPQVEKVLVYPEAQPDLSPRDLLMLAADLERSSTHPIAHALVQAADEQMEDTSSRSNWNDVEKFQQEAGSGVVGQVHGRSVAVGTLDWVLRHASAPVHREQPTISPSEPSLNVFEHEQMAEDLRTDAVASTPDTELFSGSFRSSAVEPLLTDRRGTSLATSTSSHRVPSEVHHNSPGTTVQHRDPDLTLKEMMHQERDIESGFIDKGSTSSSLEQQSRPDGNSRSLVYVAVDGLVAGVIHVADRVRSDAAWTVSELHRRGIRTVVLSGDRQSAALEVASMVGISSSDVYGSVKPGDKAALVSRLVGEGHRVAMVGDGINDTAALAAAHVGVAMGGGVDAASEVAQVVLLGDKLSQVSDAINLGHCTLRKIRQNLVWAFGYNLLALPLAAGALLPSLGCALTPSFSAALMGCSSLGVVTNSLLLRLEILYMKPHTREDGGTAG